MVEEGAKNAMVTLMKELGWTTFSKAQVHIIPLKANTKENFTSRLNMALVTAFGQTVRIIWENG